jgi:SAM-dependent methyltransferase
MTLGWRSLIAASRMVAVTFDPDAYKESVAAEWERAAAGWHKWIPSINAWLAGPTEVMLDEARVGIGSRVIDLAAGDGGQSVAAARRTGPTGHVLATDIAVEFVQLAKAVASRESLAHLQAKVMDAESLVDVPDDSYDAAISRLGLMYLPNLRAALSEIRRVLRRGGHLSAIVFTTPEDTPFFSIPVRLIRARRGLAAPDPSHPGPFSLGAPGILRTALEEAGFGEVRAQVIEAPLRLASASECVRWRREASGTMQQMLAGMDELAKTEIWTEIEQALQQFETPNGFESPCRLLVCSGVV